MRLAQSGNTGIRFRSEVLRVPAQGVPLVTVKLFFTKPRGRPDLSTQRRLVFALFSGATEDVMRMRMGCALLNSFVSIAVRCF